MPNDRYNSVTPLASQRKNFPNLDIIRFICALLIVEIHAPIFADTNGIADFYLSHVLARIGVPLFFSISGFLFFGRLEWENNKIKKSRENFQHLCHYLKQNGKIYVIWSIIYILFSLPKWYRIGWWGMTAVKDAVVAFFFGGIYYHMWYLLASIYAVPVLYFMMRYIRKQYAAVLGGLLWICQCLTYSYTWVEYQRVPILTDVFSKISVLGSVLFCAAPLLMIGAFCAAQKPLRFPKFQKWTALAAFLLCAAEASLLYFCSPNDGKYSYLFTTPLFAYAALRLLTMGKQAAAAPHVQKMLRTMSLGIYCVHPLIIDTCKAVGMQAAVLIWLTATIGAMLFAWIWAGVKEKS